MTPKEKELQEYIESTPYYGTCTQEYKEGIEDGANWQAKNIDILLNVLKLVSEKSGKWMSAALEDETSCQELKNDFSESLELILSTLKQYKQ